MRFLFLHPVFPGQFGRVMEALARDPANEVLHASHLSAVASIPGVRKLRYTLPAAAPVQTFAQKLEQTIQHGQAVLNLLRPLRERGWVPDLIYGYAGHGPTLFMKDLFPQTTLLGYFEWFLNPQGSEYNFDPEQPLAFEAQQALRLTNAAMLLDLQACDHGVTPTRWQQQQFPADHRHRLSVLHDGVDTEFYAPAPAGQTPQALLRQVGVNLGDDAEVVTYATRGMEPFRGFPAFMRALALLQKRRPNCHAVIVGKDEVHYSRPPQGAKTYQELMLRELQGELDLSRVHFTGWLDQPAYRAVLQASRAHVYLTYPYVLSWSLMEALACGCLVIGSRTPPVEEVIRDGHNGWLVDFFDHRALADRLEAALVGTAAGAMEGAIAQIRHQARETALQHYAHHKLLPKHLALLNYLALR
jgi:glycosyltransferase involved in cell wall biosynthesis